MAFPFVFLVIVSCFTSVIHVSADHHASAAQPQKPQPAKQPQGPQPVLPRGPQPAAPPGLREDYYAKTCPSFDKILLETITPKQSSNPTTAAAVLRVFFHDCFVEGCDGSVLINPAPSGPSERDNPLNLDLPGDAFDVIVRVKTAMELSCPGVVSCSDILAASARHLIKQVGGPFYKVLLGKKDGKVSKAANVDHNLVDEKQNFDTMYAPFEKKGFTVRDMVVLLGGGHTIGFAHCSRFASRIFKFSPTQDIDPSLNPSFAKRLKTLCADYVAKPDLAAFLDPLSPGKFDNNFFSNIMRGLDLLPSDHMLLTDPRSKPIVEEYAKDSNKFFADFAQAMEKLNVLGVKTGAEGEIRTNCFAFNT
ncbi:Peroxidase [Heracleum sosnowskyi]|uniref:Peroxidase n=1 Tax=Heracleum sosnowskyi TaxID=360622 RepID=A0AAD8JE37_9APIA|nr:Peroxidase [Heracleum sosnowskyi]